MLRWHRSGITPNLSLAEMPGSPVKIPSSNHLDISNDVPPTAKFEQSIYVGVMLMSMLYGIYYILFLFTMHFLRANSYITVSQRRFYFIFSFTLVLLNTVSIVGIALNGQMMWIVHRYDPGGPIWYYAVSQNLWWTVLSKSSQVAANFLAGLLLIHRCYVIFERRICVILFPLLCAFAFPALFVLRQLIYTGVIKGFDRLLELDFAVLSITVAMNTIVTVMICGRLIMAYRHQKGITDRSNSQLYPAIIVILLESSAPFCLLGIATCVLYTMDAQYEPMVQLLWYGACVIFGFSPQLIVLRAAMCDRAYGKQGVDQLTLSTLEFASYRNRRPNYTIEQSSILTGFTSSIKSK